MALPHIDDGELLPPEVAADEAPIPEPDLEQWIDHLATTDELRQVAATMEPHDRVIAERQWVVTEDDMPSTVRAFVNGDFDPELAEWAMAKLAAATERISEQAKLAEAYHRRIEHWYRRATRTDQHEVRFFDGYLCNMLRKVNDADPSVKSITLPSGTIRSRGPAPGKELVAEFTDETKFIEWAKDHRADLLRVKHEALISKVREGVTVTPQGIVAVTEDGEMVESVPGLMVRRIERTFQATPL